MFILFPELGHRKKMWFLSHLEEACCNRAVLSVTEVPRDVVGFWDASCSSPAACPWCTGASGELPVIQLRAGQYKAHRIPHLMFPTKKRLMWVLYIRNGALKRHLWKCWENSNITHLARPLPAFQWIIHWGHTCDTAKTGLISVYAGCSHKFFKSKTLPKNEVFFRLLLLPPTVHTLASYFWGELKQRNMKRVAGEHTESS